MARNYEQIIREIEGDMAIEGFKMTKENKDDLRLMFQGKVTAEDLIKKAVKKTLAKEENRLRNAG